MKNKYVFILLSVFTISCQFVQDEYIQSIEQERKAKDSIFRIESESPLIVEQINNFEGLKYFPVDKKYRVKARLDRVDSGTVIKMRTSTDRSPDYKIYGHIHFELDKKACQLTVYQNLAHQSDSLYSNLLFVPFTDDNSIILTYGGGRYIDFEIPESDTFFLDFNKAYNPYCAYNHKWSCVIPPPENSLRIAVNAGEKNYKTPY